MRSYLEIMNELAETLENDTTIPKEDKEKIKEKASVLLLLLLIYSD